MINTVFGRRESLTQVYTRKGRRVPAVWIKVASMVVNQVKSIKKDGYNASQLALNLTGKTNSARKKILREIRIGEDSVLKKGEELKIEQILRPGDLVKVTGISKGKGFAGVVKRWGFAGGPRTHGQSDRERAPGSIGQTTTPGRVWKGKKMAGRMGGGRVTIKNLEVLSVNPQENRILLKGLVPGGKKTLLQIEKIGEAKRFEGVLTEGAEIKPSGLGQVLDELKKDGEDKNKADTAKEENV